MRRWLNQEKVGLGEGRSRRSAGWMRKRFDEKRVG